MMGMDARTGRAIAGVDHIRQSIADILSTPIGTRIGRREYGSLLPDLLDQPMNAGGRLRLFAATALALLRWEPRIRLNRIDLANDSAGAFRLTLDVVRLDVAIPAPTRLVVPIRATPPA